MPYTGRVAIRKSIFSEARQSLDQIVKDGLVPSADSFNLI